MKKLISLFIFAWAAINLAAQCDLPYKPLSAFGTDTVAFMKYNFVDRADYYVGKTLKEVAKDLQIPILDFSAISTSLGPKFMPDRVEGIRIYISIPICSGKYA